MESRTIFCDGFIGGQTPSFLALAISSKRTQRTAKTIVQRYPGALCQDMSLRSVKYQGSTCITPWNSAFDEYRSIGPPSIVPLGEALLFVGSTKLCRLFLDLRKQTSTCSEQVTDVEDIAMSDNMSLWGGLHLSSMEFHWLVFGLIGDFFRGDR